MTKNSYVCVFQSKVIYSASVSSLALFSVFVYSKGRR